MERKGMQVIKDVASKTAGLVFFSLLAIALGVVFGVMFERWIGGETGIPTSTDFDLGIEEFASLPTVEPAPVDEDTAATGQTAVEPVSEGVKYRVRVGPYDDYKLALEAAEDLRNLGYPVYLANRAPYMVQVGAFANQDNALTLQAELTKKGYDVAIQPE